jgi:rod shape-determining protein MreD
MKRIYPPLILFLLLVLEGVALELLPAKFVMGSTLIIPHWIFIYLVFVAVFYDEENTHFSVLYGAVFGLLTDIVYTGVLGVYMFSYAVSAFVIYGMRKMLHDNLPALLLLSFTGIVLADVMIHVIYMVIGITDMAWDNYLIARLLPTVLANLLFLIVLYPLFRNQLLKWRRESLNRNHLL